MGFLDHSTNSIIVDAVLTDNGRRALADQEVGFIVAKFSLGDDEIDYNIIKQFGRTVGKEKIEKNTPVLEAFTQSNLAQKHRLTSINNPTLIRMPVISTGVSDNLIAIKRSSRNTTKSIDLTIKKSDQEIIPIGIADTTVTIQVDNRFINLVGVPAPISVSKDNIATYRLTTTRAAAGSEINGKINFNIKSISDSDFAKFSRAASDLIRTFIIIEGKKSGVRQTIEVRIS